MAFVRSFDNPLPCFYTLRMILTLSRSKCSEVSCVKRASFSIRKDTMPSSFPSNSLHVTRGSGQLRMPLSPTHPLVPAGSPPGKRSDTPHEERSLSRERRLSPKRLPRHPPSLANGAPSRRTGTPCPRHPKTSHPSEESGNPPRSSKASSLEQVGTAKTDRKRPSS